MKYLFIFILGFISYAGLLEYLEYKDYKNWNIATFQYREDIFGENTLSKREEIIAEKIETKYDKLLSKLLYRPFIGNRCLFFGSDKGECPISFLKFNVDDLRYNVYCLSKTKIVDETVGKNLKVLEAEELKKRYKDRNCVMILQNTELL